MIPDRSPGEPALRGERVLARLDGLVVRAESLLGRALPARLDPISQPGAAANACLLIAIASGILVLPWYVPSVHEARASVAEMQASLLPRTLRALHRWSSDAAMAFVLLHATRLLIARRVAGARWLAWTTGGVLLGLLWIVGWLGFWLAWDGVGRQVALATAGVADVLPIGIDPLTRSFVADSALSTLLFFVVFFIHMLLPLGMGAALWLHVVRTARPKFLPPRALFVAIGLALLAVSLVVPAPLASAAHMAVVPGRMSVDAWYVAPILVAERLSSGALLALGLGAFIAFVTLPWTLAKGRSRIARVDARLCNACTRCVEDCPFAAIGMVPREGSSTLVASIDPARCVGCGICSGSCEPSAIGLPWLDQQGERRRIDAWLAEDPAALMVLGCEGSAAGALKPDSETGLTSRLPGARVMLAPCSGWFSAYTVERALRRGTGRVLVVGCEGASCRYREGDAILRKRLTGGREPALRRDKVDLSRLDVVELAPHRAADLLHAAGLARRPSRSRALAAGSALAIALAGVVVALGSVPHAPLRPAQPQLVVSFAHRGLVLENCRDRTPEELAALPPHMRTPRACTRERAPVRLRVAIDGREVHRSAHAAAGAWGDGPSLAIVTLGVPAGLHHVEVWLGDSADPDEWAYSDARDIELSRDVRRTIQFDRADGFRWE